MEVKQEGRVQHAARIGEENMYKNIAQKNVK
jgi:hypothetical protein